MTKITLTVASLLSAAITANAVILNTDFNASITSQTLTGYVANDSDLSSGSLTNTFTETLDWHSWGDGDLGNANNTAPTNWMNGGVGIGESLALGGVAFFHSNTRFTEVDWNWSDGDAGGSFTSSTHINGSQTGDDANNAGLRFETEQVFPGTEDAWIDVTFAADPLGTARAATVLFRRDASMTISALQGAQNIAINTSTDNGLVTVEYDGTDDLTIRFFIADQTQDTQLLRMGAATLSTIPEPGAYAAILGLMTVALLLIRRRQR